MLALALGIIADCYFKKGKISKKFELIIGMILGKRNHIEENMGNSKQVVVDLKEEENAKLKINLV